MKKISVACIALMFATLVSILPTTPATSAQELAETFSCWYNPGDGKIHYSLFQGQDTTYTVYCNAYPRIIFTEGCVDLHGPSEQAAAAIACAGEGTGSVEVKIHIKDGPEMYRCQICFNCSKTLEVKEKVCYAGPTMTEWGLVVFAGLFIAVLIFMLRRRRAGVPTPA